MYHKDLRDKRLLSLHSLITLWSVKLAALPVKFSLQSPYYSMSLLQQYNKAASVVMMHQLFLSSAAAKGGRTLQKATDSHLEQLSNQKNKCQESVWVERIRSIHVGRSPPAPEHKPNSFVCMLCECVMYESVT